MIIRLNILRRFFFALVAFIITDCAALGQNLSLSLAKENQSAAPGRAVEFDATLVNTSTAVLFLNGIDVGLAGDGVASDTTPFFTDVPLSLSAGQSFSGPLFNITSDPQTSGFLTGNVSLFGGIDSSATDLLASSTFSVDVEPVPEPAAFLLVGLALVLLCVSQGKRKAIANAP
jgi:hypothetical protein